MEINKKILSFLLLIYREKSLKSNIYIVARNLRQLTEGLSAATNPIVKKEHVLRTLLKCMVDMQSDIGFSLELLAFPNDHGAFSDFNTSQSPQLHSSKKEEKWFYVSLNFTLSSSFPSHSTLCRTLEKGG